MEYSQVEASMHQTSHRTKNHYENKSIRINPVLSTLYIIGFVLFKAKIQLT